MDYSILQSRLFNLTEGVEKDEKEKTCVGGVCVGDRLDRERIGRCCGKIF